MLSTNKGQKLDFNVKNSELLWGWSLTAGSIAIFICYAILKLLERLD